MSQPLPNKNLPMPSLRNIQAFIEVAATGSLNLAAENLNITASAVSHQIASLEHFLGKKLFSRSSKGVMLTAVGEKISQRGLRGAEYDWPGHQPGDQ
ncbi:LysR family transcriptional regulator [Klebsiella variicola]|nr:LysR family transcriptional regulator [Klebsiella variicola]